MNGRQSLTELQTGRAKGGDAVGYITGCRREEKSAGSKREREKGEKKEGGKGGSGGSGGSGGGEGRMEENEGKPKTAKISPGNGRQKLSIGE